MSEKIDGLENITEYLREMKLKGKFFGGCDKEDVLRHINTITQMYNGLLQEYKDQYSSAVRELIELREVQQKDSAQLYELRHQIEATASERETYQGKSRILSDTVVQLHQDREETLARAEREAQWIIQKAQEQAQEVTLERNRILDSELTEKHRQLSRLQAEIRDAEQQRDEQLSTMRVPLQLIRSDLKTMLTNIEHLEKHLEDEATPEPEQSSDKKPYALG